MKRSALILALLLCLMALCLNASAVENGYALHGIDPGEDGVTVTLTAKQSCTLAAAVYDADGRLLDANTKRAPAGVGISVHIPLDLSAEGGKEVKAFLLDEKTGVPLCLAETEDLTAPEEVYAFQSEDGTTLTFCSTLPEGVSLEDENVWKVEDFFNDTGMKDEDYDRPVLHPWSGDCLETVVFADRVRPTSTAYWFERCGGLTSVQGIENLDTSRVVSMRMMFDWCFNLPALNVSGFDTSQVTKMGGMFAYCKSLLTLDLSGFDTSRVKDMERMFTICGSLTVLDLSAFDTSQVKSMYGMFDECEKLRTIYVSPSFVTEQLSFKANVMFYRCFNLVGGSGKTFDSAHQDSEYARIDRLGKPGYFTEK